MENLNKFRFALSAIVYGMLGYYYYMNVTLDLEGSKLYKEFLGENAAINDRIVAMVIIGAFVYALVCAFLMGLGKTTLSLFIAFCMAFSAICYLYHVDYLQLLMPIIIMLAEVLMGFLGVILTSCIDFLSTKVTLPGLLLKGLTFIVKAAYIVLMSYFVSTKIIEGGPRQGAEE